MRPSKLTMTAFGPYAGVQTIDFQQLQERNLFVISGNTGSGKTFILDAICYALYGEASSSDRDGDSLRSHFPQDSQLLTSVELEFSLKGSSMRCSAHRRKSAKLSAAQAQQRRQPRLNSGACQTRRSNLSAAPQPSQPN